MRNRAVSAVSPRSARQYPAGQYLHIPFHEQGSAAGKVPINTNIDGLGSEADLEGTTTSVWGTAGYLNVAADAGDNAMVIGGYANATMQAFMQPASGKQILLACTVRPSNFTASQLLLTWSPGDATEGGIAARITDAELFQIRNNPNGTTSQTNIAASSALSTSADSKIVALLDPVTLTTLCYVNGALVGTLANMPTPVSSLNADHALTFFAGSGTASPNNLASESFLIADFWLVRPESSVSDRIDEIVDEYQGYSRELRLTTLSGV